MNVFNRLVVIVLLLVIIVLTAIVVLAPRESLRTAAVTFDWLQQGVSNYMQSDRLLFAAGRVIIGGLVVIAALVLLLSALLWREVPGPLGRAGIGVALVAVILVNL